MISPELNSQIISHFVAVPNLCLKIKFESLCWLFWVLKGKCNFSLARFFKKKFLGTEVHLFVNFARKFFYQNILLLNADEQNQR